MLFWMHLKRILWCDALGHSGRTGIVCLSVRTDGFKLFLCEFFLIAQSPGTHATVLGGKSLKFMGECFK